MARISGVTVPAEKQVWVSLTYVYGLGPKSAKDILTRANVEFTTRVKDLTDAEIGRIQEVINADYLVEGELQRIVSGNIKRLKDIKAYRGLRHAANLPSKGQRTKTTVGGTAKKVASKT
jgi:small subunit ribosomal protein S13